MVAQSVTELAKMIQVRVRARGDNDQLVFVDAVNDSNMLNASETIDEIIDIILRQQMRFIAVMSESRDD